MKDFLKLPDLSGTSAQSDKKIINALEKSDLDKRIKELEKNNADLKKLKAAKDKLASEQAKNNPNKIGARKHDSFKAVATAPSFNKTPVGSYTPPLPYVTTQDLSNSIGIVPTVKYNCMAVVVLDQSTQPNCKGDEAGSAKGVKSGTVSGEVKPVAGSCTVRIGGKYAIREDDPCTMNGGNNPGIYTTTQTPSGSIANGQPTGDSNPPVKAQTPAEKDWLDQLGDKAKSAAKSYKEGVSEAVHNFAGDAMEKGGTIASAGGATAAVGGVMVATAIGAAPGAVLVAGGGITAAIGGGVAAVGGVVESGATALDKAVEFAANGKMPDLAGAAGNIVGGIATDLAKNIVLKKLTQYAQHIPGYDKLTTFIPGNKKKPTTTTKDKDPKKAPPAGGDGVKVLGSGSDGDCGIKAYKDQKCPKGQQAHHIVPDYALRYGNRKNGEARIPGMPSLDDGPSICLSGGSKSKGEEHNRAHEGTDPKINALGQRTDNGHVGIAPIGDLIDISVDEVAKVKPHCKDEIKKKTDEAFKGVDRSKYGRTTQALPKGEAQGSLSRGETHGTTTPKRRK